MATSIISSNTFIGCMKKRMKRILSAGVGFLKHQWTSSNLRRSVYVYSKIPNTDMPSVAPKDTAIANMGTKIQSYGNAFDDPASEMIWEAEP